MKRAVVFMADGFEELEAVAVIDILRRGGVHVEAVSVTGERAVTGSHGISLVCDGVLGLGDGPDSGDGGHDGIMAMDAAFLPGGPGTELLLNDGRVLGIIKGMHERGKVVAAICAAPKVLVKAGVAKGRKVTSYPGALGGGGDYEFVGGDVVADGTVVTGKAAGTAGPFALAVLRALGLHGEADKVGLAMFIG